MKKSYITPEIEIVVYTTEEMIATSPISSEVGLGYGGVVPDDEVETIVPQ